MDFEQPKEFTITPMNIEQPSVDNQLAKQLIELSQEFNADHNFVIMYVDKEGVFRMKAKDSDRKSILEMLLITQKTVIDSYSQKK